VTCEVQEKDDRRIEVDNRAAAESNRATGDANPESERAGAIEWRAGDRCKSVICCSRFTRVAHRATATSLGRFDTPAKRRRSIFLKNSETFPIGSGENK
jgi:hypothetical protein